MVTGPRSGGRILPDLPGKVHGIKSISPCVVQCDGCALVVEGDHLGFTVLTCGIIFNTRLPDDGRRMCANCWKGAGWVEEYGGWVRA